MPSIPFQVLSARRLERPVTLRLPFRFGAATVTEAVQAFVQVRIRLADGSEADGATAEMMMPRWFDKSPLKSAQDIVDDLRATLDDACSAYAGDGGARCAFGHSAAHAPILAQRSRQRGLTPLTGAYGPALLDKALLDALCRASHASIGTALRNNLPGLDATLAPDLAGFDIPAFLATLTLPARIHVRHTVGMLDRLDSAAGDPLLPDDGLPVTLAQVIARHGVHHFKLKLCGRPDDDLARLRAIAAALDGLPSVVITLDGNEQFTDAGSLLDFVDAFRADAALRRLSSATLYLEQPLARDASFDVDVHAVAAQLPLLIDEADGDLDAFPRARARGYTGVSSKSCKGVYKSLINTMRCVRHNGETADAPRLFVSAEDLTAPAGLAVQQDLALAGLLGLTHVERNGHHYVHGFSGQHAPAAEALAFHDRQPDLYERSAGGVVLRIHEGAVDLRSLDRPGFATSVHPDFDHWPARVDTNVAGH